MSVDDDGLLAQILPVFLLVVMLESGVMGTAESEEDTPDRLSRIFDHWTVLYRAYMITSLSVAEFYAILRAMDRLPRSEAADDAALSVLSASVTLLMLVSITQRTRRHMLSWHLAALGIGFVGLGLITWMLYLVTKD